MSLIFETNVLLSREAKNTAMNGSDFIMYDSLVSPHIEYSESLASEKDINERAPFLGHRVKESNW